MSRAHSCASTWPPGVWGASRARASTSTNHPPESPLRGIRPGGRRVDSCVMRRILVLATIALALLAPAGCSGVDAQQAQSILDQSTTATANVKSISFAMRMWTSGGPEGTDFTVLMHGG